MRLRRLATACLLALASAASAQVKFADGTFADADWSASITFDSTPGGASFTAAQSGTTRETRHDWTGPGGFVVTHLRAGATYDPSTQGAIASVEHAFDLLFVNGSPGTSQVGHRLVLKQGATLGSTVGFTGLGIATLGAGTVTSTFTLLPSDLPGIDFSASGGPIQFGYQTNNGEQLGNTLFTVSRIDNWSVRVNRVCTTTAECDDGDPCTTDTCDNGGCHSVPLDCDDGDGCTIDACSNGTCGHTAVDCDDGRDCTADTCTGGQCQHPASADEALVLAKIGQLLSIVQGAACGESPLAKTVAKKLAKKLKKARTRIVKAEGATKAAAIDKLLTKAGGLLAAASTLLGTAASSGLVPPDCAAELQTFLGEVRECLASVPRP